MVGKKERQETHFLKKAMACRQKGMFGSAVRILSLTDQRVNIIKQRTVPLLWYVRGRGEERGRREVEQETGTTVNIF